MPLEVLASPRVVRTAQWLVKHTALHGLRPRIVTWDERLTEGQTDVLSFLANTDKPSILVAHVSPDSQSLRPLMGVDINIRSPMGQNSFQNFPRAVYCSLIGVPYVGMTPFADLVPKQTGHVALERLSPLLFPAINKLYEFTHVPVSLVPWPGSVDTSHPVLSQDQDNLPEAESDECRGLFSIIDELVARLVVDREQAASLRLESVVPWTKLLKELSPRDLPPLDRHSVELVPTSLVGWRTGMNGSFDWPVSDETSGRLDSVIFHTRSRTVRHFPYAGSALLWDILLCRTGLSTQERTRNLVINFSCITVEEFLRSLPASLLVQPIQPGMYILSPGSIPPMDAIRTVPMDSHLFIQVADALVFTDGWVLPQGFDVAASVRGRESVELALSSPVQARYFVFTEGDDRPILQRIARTAGDRVTLERPELEWRKIGGAGNWRKVCHFPWSANALGEQVTTFLILDRDFRTDDEVQSIIEELKAAGVSCHVWNRKEIENYLLSSEAISAATVEEITKRKGCGDVGALREQITVLLDQALEEHRSHTFSQLLLAQLTQSRGKEPTTIEQFHSSFDQLWLSREYRLNRAGGKRVLKSLNRLLMERYGVSLTLDRILNQMTLNDLDSDLMRVLAELQGLLT